MGRGPQISVAMLLAPMVCKGYYLKATRKKRERHIKGLSIFKNNEMHSFYCIPTRRYGMGKVRGAVFWYVLLVRGRCYGTCNLVRVRCSGTCNLVRVRCSGTCFLVRGYGVPVRVLWYGVRCSGTCFLVRVRVLWYGHGVLARIRYGVLIRCGPCCFGRMWGGGQGGQKIQSCEFMMRGALVG